MTDLTAFDIFFFAALGLFAILGLIRGFVTEILGLFAWVAAIVAVNLFFDRGRDVALGFIDSPTTAAVFAVIGIFLTVFIVGKLLAKGLGGRVKDSIIGPLDRILGLGFGTLKGLLLAVLAWMLMTLAFDVVPGARPEWLADSRSGPLLDILSHEVSDFVADRREETDIEAANGYSDEERNRMDALFEDDL